MMEKESVSQGPCVALGIDAAYHNHNATCQCHFFLFYLS